MVNHPVEFGGGGKKGNLPRPGADACLMEIVKIYMNQYVIIEMMV